MAVYTITLEVKNGNFVLPANGETGVYGFSALSEIGINSTAGDVVIVSDDAAEKSAKENAKNKNYVDKKLDCARFKLGDAIAKVEKPKEVKAK